MKFKIINGLQIFAPYSREELINFALKEKKILIALGAEKIYHTNDVTKNIINKNIGYPDGIGAVLALKKKGFKNTVKIPGCELWLDIINKFNKHKTFYLIGGEQEIITKVIRKLNLEYPGINILNYRNGYLKTKSDQHDLIEDIKQKKPDIVFVAMGSPKQELLMNEIYLEHNAIYLGLGGSFDIYAGKNKRAPKWWIDHKLEGFYRLIQQPTRIKRFVKVIPFWFKLLIFGKIK